VEKAIKAVLVLNGVPYGRTHDLVELGYRTEEAVPGSPLAIDRLIRLNPYAVAFRYGEPAVDLLEPEEAEEVVASVTAWADACIRAMEVHESGPV
jgi:HEPN domain-containing protein